MRVNCPCVHVPQCVCVCVCVCVCKCGLRLGYWIMADIFCLFQCHKRRHFWNKVKYLTSFTVVMLRGQLREINLPAYPMPHLTCLSNMLPWFLFYFIHAVWTMYLHIFVRRKCFNQLFVKQIWNVLHRMKRKLLCGTLTPSNPVSLSSRVLLPLPFHHTQASWRDKSRPSVPHRWPFGVLAPSGPACCRRADYWGRAGPRGLQSHRPRLCHCRGSSRKQRWAPGWTDAGWLAWECRRSKYEQCSVLIVPWIRTLAW